MKEVVILGNGGMAREVAFLIDSINMQSPEWNILGYIAKDESEVGKPNGKYPIFASDSWLVNYEKPLNIAIGFGDPGISSKICSGLMNKGNLSFPNFKHPNVIGDWDRIKMGQGNIICASNIFTIDVEIGDFNIFNVGCITMHDCAVGNYNILNPSANISGGVKIGDNNLIGTGAQVLQYLTIGNNNKIGGGAVVNKDIVESGTYVGVPARKIK